MATWRSQRGGNPVKWLAVLSAIVAMSTYSWAQSWTYRGNSICYDFGSASVQCYGAGTIQRNATNQEQFNSQFDAGYKAGEGIGNLVGALLKRWAERHRVLNEERNDLRTLLRSYDKANGDLVDDVSHQYLKLSELWPKLALYIPPVAKDSDAVIAQYRKLASEFLQQKSESTKNIEIIAGAKDTKFLRGCLEVEKRRYGTLYQAASRGYVFVEFVKAVVGYYEYKASESQSVPTEATLTHLGTSTELDKLITSAYQGDFESQIQLGKLFVDGQGVPQNYVAAHMWFNLASAAGVSEARVLREAVADKMTERCSPFRDCGTVGKMPKSNGSRPVRF